MRHKINRWLFLIGVILIILVNLITNLFDNKNEGNRLLIANVQSDIDRNAKIVINQIGYYPYWYKSAFLLNANKASIDKAQLINCKNKKPVLSINPGKQLKDATSQDVIQTLEFTNFHQQGCYYLKYGDIKSYPFQIGNNIYEQPLAKMLHSYYLQRCGTAINDPVTGIHHATCHLNDGIVAHNDTVHRAGKQISAQGGWHDAGDYGKYIASTTVTVARLLSLYEQAPSLFKDNQLTIPESGNAIPDLLDEVKVGLDWMLTMQRSDGAVYRKLSGKEWPFNKTPDEDKQPRFIYGISTPETGKFAAVMAMAARIYAFNTQLAQSYLQAAEKAWAFLQTSSEMKVEYFSEDDSGSGKYLLSEVDTEETLKTDKDDRLWAAAELWSTTGRSNFETYFVQNIAACPYNLFEWKNGCPLGLIDYLVNPKGSGELKQQIKEKVIQKADDLMKNVERSGYRIANDRFIWGSNKMTAEDGITLLYAYQLTGDRAYWQAALDQLNYLLGRNHFNKSFVTGVGTNPVQHINNLFSRAARIYIPGLLAGGPNNGAQDNIAPKNQGSLSYVDDERSYATNENAIDYNASMITLMGMLMQAK